MPYKKGHTKTGGRQKGVENKDKSELRKRIAKLLDDNYPKFVDAFGDLKGKELIDRFTLLIEYCTPKLNRTDLTNDGDKFDFSIIDGDDAIAGINKLLEQARERASSESGSGS